MARIRSIKPEFWTDEKMARCSDHARLLFLAMISMADDAGRLLDNVKQIEAFVWPFSDTDQFASHARIIRGALDELVENGRIRRGDTVSGQKIIQIVNWVRHQRIDKPNIKGALPEIVAPQQLTGSTNHSSNHSSNGSANHSPPEYDQGPRTKEKDQGERPVQRADAREVSEDFVRAWAAYPRRTGSNPRQTAAKAFAARVADGVSPDVLIAAATAYARWVEATVEDRRFVLQAATFFGPDRRWEDDWSVPDGDGLSARQRADLGLDDRLWVRSETAASPEAA